MSVINTPIPPQAFEQIRDQIGAVLTVELANQATLQTGPLQDILENVNVFQERWAPVGAAELFSVEPFFFSADYDPQDANDSRASNVYYIDVKGRGAYSDVGGGQIEDGDKQAAQNTQRLVGIIRAILEDPNYLCLGFKPNPFIEHTRVVNIKRTEERDTRDANSVMMYRIIFEVQAIETTEPILPGPLNVYNTQVKIAETEKGYLYVLDETP